MKLKGEKTGFTIIELLTVMSIIVILISIMMPALNKVRRFAKVVGQKGQFHEISKGLELYRNEHEETYPDSGAADATGLVGYCGAMKLCEAMLGQDGMGFHPSSRFLADATTSGPSNTDLYPFDLCVSIDPADPIYLSLMPNLRERKKYIDTDNIRPFRLEDIYNWAVSGGRSYGPPLGPQVAFQSGAPLQYPNTVISDVFLHPQIRATRCPQHAGEKVGMPVLYYKADPSKLSHDANNPTLPDNIYNFDDNWALTALGCPWEPAQTTVQPLWDAASAIPGKLFYQITQNDKVTSTPRPHNEDGYILISAGYDGLYGTRDDVYNFAD
jgi:prepilin-type N-terminal cleavage/methylation domain-containing protein